MTTPAQPDQPLHWGRELVVPALMLGGAGLFVYGSLHLSAAAWVLPAGLIAVVVLALVWALASAALRPRTARPTEQGEDEDRSPILNPKSWLLVALPAVLFALIDYLGALVVLIALVFGAQLIFTRVAPVRSLLIAVAVTLPTYALFKYVLYARFPAGALGLG